MMDWIDLTFARPAVLWALVILPLVAVLGRILGVHRRGLPRSALLLRLAVIALLILTLAEPLQTSGGSAVNTVFVVDRSKSISDDTSAQIDTWIAAALAEAGSEDRAAVITFGASPALAAPAARARDLGRLWPGPPDAERESTDIESALALARALPLGGARRIVLISDGAENLGAALNQAGQAAADGTPIDVVPVEGVGEGDLRIEGATAPASAWFGETINVLASVATGLGGKGKLELLINGVTQISEEKLFPPGLSSYAFQVTDLEPGFHALTVRVSGTTVNDRYLENNEMPLALVVRDAPKLLLVAPTGSDPGVLRSALERRGAQVTVVAPADVSSRLSEIGAYDAIVLDNVPAGALTLDQMTGLREATRKLGRGLIVLGGTSSYGPGGYAGTVLEETLPVTVKVTDGRERQRVALLFIVDKSGSMSYDPLGGTSKMEMAKEAVRVGAQALSNGDEVGILVFNDQQHWVVPMTLIRGPAERERINAAIDQISADGGTEIYPALNVGFDAISRSEADVRHVVLLSDGKSRTGTDESYRKLIEEHRTGRTTLSTIAIGDDADTELMQKLAEWGDGRYHFTEKSEDIPKLTLAEAQSAGSQSVIRGAFRPLQVRPSPILTGFDPEELPMLEGYDFAEAKFDAQVVLTSERDDPILAKWQLGLGRVVAWTADAGADFALGWPSWPRYDEFWANLVRWALPDPENRPIQVQVERQGAEAVITVNAIGEHGDYVDFAETWATITAPSGSVTANVLMYQSGPGEYQLRVAAPEPGAYRIELRQQRGNAVLEELAGFAVPPSPELQPAPHAHALLRALAARTGGRILSLDEPGEVFSSSSLSGTALRDYRPVWHVPLALAFCALLVELGIRFDFFSRLRGVRLLPRAGA